MIKIKDMVEFNRYKNNYNHRGGRPNGKDVIELNSQSIKESPHVASGTTSELKEGKATPSNQSPHSSAVEHVSRKTSAEASMDLVEGSTPSEDTHSQSNRIKETDYCPKNTEQGGNGKELSDKKTHTNMNSHSDIFTSTQNLIDGFVAMSHKVYSKTWMRKEQVDYTAWNMVKSELKGRLDVFKSWLFDLIEIRKFRKTLYNGVRENQLKEYIKMIEEVLK